MKKFPAVLAAIVLGAAGFAAAGIASGSKLLDSLTGTTATTTTTTQTQTTGEGGQGRRVTICHHTHSKKHPFHTITVSQHAVQAHLRHGDELGACPASAPTTSPHGRHGHHGESETHGKTGMHGKSGEHRPTTTTTVTTTTSATNDSSNEHGNSGHGDNGHGHGKP